MINEHSYKPVIAFSILIGIILLIIFVNPNTFHKPYFNDTFEEDKYEDVDLSTNYKIEEYVRTRNEWVSDSVLRLKRSGEITEEQGDKIIEESNEAKRELDTYKSTGSEADLYRALFKTQEAISYKKSYPFFNCVDNVYNLSKRYKPLFYYLGYKDRERVLELRGSQENLGNYLKYSIRYTEENETILRLVRDTEDIERRNKFYELKCEQFRDYLTKDYNRQKIWFVFKLLAVITIFVIGFILGNILTKKNFKKIEKKSNWLMDGIKRAFSPQEIKDETIDSILKINSVTTTLVAFLGIALTISGFNNWIFLGIILICMLSLLTSILFGVIAQNSKSQAHKKICYRLFIFGLAFFIIFFAYILVGGIAAQFFKALGESAKTYLNNQTIVK